MNAKNRIAAFFPVVVFIAALSCPQAHGENLPRLGEAPVKEVIAAMSLEEKASLVVGTGMDMSLFPGAASAEPEPFFGEEPEKSVDGAAGTTHIVSRLGISTLVLADGPAGLRINPTREGDEKTYYCTAFPVSTLLASTWDTELVYEVGRAMGGEVLAYGVDMLLAPGMNIHRNPLGGRNFEYYSEDPLVSGKMAGAIVGGVQSRGVGATIKHYAANNAETNRMALDTIVGERALREIYLEGFRIAVQEARPWAVMSAYNKINGTYAPQSSDLLTAVLRDDWGFEGFVMTDWMGGDDPVAAMVAGNDMLMPGGSDQFDAIVAAVKEGRLDEGILDRNVERILAVLVKSPGFKGYAYTNSPDLKQHAALTRQAAADGMVLLKNAGAALPLPKETRTIAAFGNTSYDIITGGTGSGDVNEAYSVALEAGLENAGLSVDETLGRAYVAYLEAQKANRPERTFFEKEVPIAEMALSEALITESAGKNDCAIITIGRNSGEGNDREAVEGDFELTQTEKTMIRKVTDAFHEKGKKSIVILNVGGVVETASWRDIPDAILLAWQGGQETGNSIADVLSGSVNPSGKLAATFPMTYEDVPSARNFPGVATATVSGEEKDPAGLPKAVPSEIVYEEGIYVGYRYYDSFKVPTAYEFGYGLSYTQFKYSGLELSAKKFDGAMTVTVTVKNTGKTAGREVVQLYLSAPGKALEKPEKELKAFGKTGLLAPGESQRLTFTLDERSLASYDPASAAWVAEAGKYTVKIGASSADIRQEKTFTLKKALVVKETSRALTPGKTIQEMTP